MPHCLMSHPNFPFQKEIHHIKEVMIYGTFEIIHLQFLGNLAPIF